MDREQIEQAAEKHAADINAERLSAFPEAVRSQLSPEYNADDLSDAFKAGAEWRINSVWHDASEEPEQGRAILCIGVNVYGTFIAGPNNEDFNSIVKDFGVLRWANIEDLLPDRKEDEI